jgi:hypothetical protein
VSFTTQFRYRPAPGAATSNAGFSVKNPKGTREKLAVCTGMSA